jgi:hypothetical protein
VADSLQQQQQQQQQLLAVCIGGQPPVSGSLLAAVRVMLGQVRHWTMAVDSGPWLWPMALMAMLLTAMSQDSWHLALSQAAQPSCPDAMCFGVHGPVPSQRVAPSLMFAAGPCPSSSPGLAHHNLCSPGLAHHNLCSRDACGAAEWAAECHHIIMQAALRLEHP